MDFLPGGQRKRILPDSGGSPPLSGCITALLCIPQDPAGFQSISLAPTTSGPISSFMLRGRKWSCGSVRVHASPPAFTWIQQQLPVLFSLQIARLQEAWHLNLGGVSLNLGGVFLNLGGVFFFWMKSCQRAFCPAETESGSELDGLNILSWLMGLLRLLLVTAAWHPSPGEPGPPTDFKDMLVPSAASSVSIYLVPLFYAPFDQNDWFDSRDKIQPKSRILQPKAARASGSLAAGSPEVRRKIIPPETPIMPLGGRNKAENGYLKYVLQRFHSRQLAIGQTGSGLCSVVLPKAAI